MMQAREVEFWINLTKITILCIDRPTCSLADFQGNRLFPEGVRIPPSSISIPFFSLLQTKEMRVCFPYDKGVPGAERRSHFLAWPYGSVRINGWYSPSMGFLKNRGLNKE